MENIAPPTPKQRTIEMITNLDDNISMEAIHKAVSDLDKSVWKNTLPKTVFIVTGLFAFATFIYFIISSYTSKGIFTAAVPKDTKIILLDYLLYTFWTIVPPSYFLWEYLTLFPYKLDSGQLSDIKYTQELSSKIWAALLFAFGILLYSKYGVR